MFGLGITCFAFDISFVKCNFLIAQCDQRHLITCWRACVCSLISMCWCWTPSTTMFTKITQFDIRYSYLFTTHLFINCTISFVYLPPALLSLIKRVEGVPRRTRRPWTELNARRCHVVPVTRAQSWTSAGVTSPHCGTVAKNSPWSTRINLEACPVEWRQFVWMLAIGQWKVYIHALPS